MTTTHRLLELSTAHLSPTERDGLLPASPGAGHRFVGPMSVYWYTDEVTARAHVLIGDEAGGAWRDQWPTLAEVHDEAQRLGATMLLIDPDADTIEGLAHFD